LTSDPPGATVWIDHVKIGAAPVTVVALPGEHLVAAGDGAKRASARVTVEWAAVSTTLALVDQTGQYSAVAGVVKSWRDGKLTPTAEALGTVMDALHVRFAIVLTGKRTAQVWARAPHDKKPRKVDDAPTKDPIAIGALVTERVAAWDDHAPDPDQQLLRETPEERAERLRKSGPPEHWWVYALIVGVVATGSGFLYFQDAADDHQTITLHFP
jgi:hypothetical protein